MIRSYLKTAFRSFSKNKTFSFINVIGLTIGTLCCLYIVMYVADQYSYDKHEDHAGDIYRITSTLKTAGDVHLLAVSSPPAAAAMKRDFAEVAQFTRVLEPRVFGAEQHLLKYQDQSFYVQHVLFADSTFFDVFSYHFISGTPRSLMAPFSTVLLKSTADKLFGKEDPMGKTIRINNKAGEETLTVTGVVDESLGGSHIDAGMFINMNSGLIGDIVRRTDSWAGGNMLYAYVKLQPGTDKTALERKLPAFLQRYGKEQLQALHMEKLLTLQPIADIHTDTSYEVELSKTVSPVFLRILLLIAILIQVIACINFMNLSTARASQRAREVGVRKVMGAGRKDLVRQFLGESLLLSLMGVLLAVPLLYLLLPFLNTITEAEIRLSFLSDYRPWLILLGITTATGLMAGLYPALYLSAFQAIKVIRGNFSNRISAAGLRRSLVVFQFVLSIVLITGIVVIYSQLHYIRHKDLGFERDQKLIFNIYTGGVNITALTADLQQLPEVKAVTRSNSQLGKQTLMTRNVYLPGGNAADGEDVPIMVSDKYFVRAAGIRLLAGRDFRDFDSGRVLINATLAKRLRINPNTAEGARLYVSSGDEPATAYEVAGIVRDFHFNSLHETVKPFMLLYDPQSPALCDIMVNTESSNYKALLAKIKIIWQRNAPGLPFQYSFLDDEVQKQYETEIVLSNIINAFTGMAILISCLGLFGLAAFSAEQRSKEIGIRKVLGASIPGIVQLLSKDFLKLVLIALLLATPISWWTMDKWLQGFAYRIPLSWWMFALAGAVAVLIALCTVSVQAIKGALANPIRSLGRE
ncbi:FtsX-like permease family protein [Chitinophaga agrisoli]|uniref:FtsX-like permease family protein n=1 Tax=Chitinophaga agrisoli TaxID=2607653 RepID=A0A5B2VNC0_9BACT|nr:ABC transporter permease [Chitinophaga agrisoli]KAA2240170.1 FtsX-like permease family protein [Chitinophaga agrisoli]